ncbi:MAG: hypothetical protein AAF725_06125, partial [Acidobacteriota bacterium]
MNKLLRLLPAPILAAAVLSPPSLAQNADEARFAKPSKPGAAKKVEYVPGRLLVRFADDSLYRSQLTREQKSFGVYEVVQKAEVRDALVELGVLEMKRVVTKLRPEHLVSKSRSGQNVAIPDLVNLMTVEVDPEADLLAARQRLSKVDGVLYAELDHLMYDNGTPNDSEYFRQLGFERSNDRDIDADRAWDFQTGTQAVKVGVIDSGIDYHHEDLGNGAFGVAGAKVRGGWDFFNN